MMNEDEDAGFEPVHTSSPTDHVLNELQLYGWRRFQDEPDPRPLPEGNAVATAVADIFDALVATLGDTRLEPDLDDLLWGAVNLFHRVANRVLRELDDNEQAQRRLQREQDGSEVKSVELERLTAEGQTLIERRDSMELFRDLSAEAFEHHTGSAWRPRTGSMVNHRHLTSAMIDSRDFLAAKRRAEKEVLLHGGSPKGAELIASRWADARKVQQVSFKPDWTKHGKAAPFKRNDVMLETLPVGVLVFPGTGIQENLADKAKKLGIPVMKFDGGA